MEKIGLINELYFYAMCGTKPAVPDYVYIMRDEVVPDKLRDALRIVIGGFRYFGLRPLTDREGSLWFEHNEIKPEVYPEGRETIFGTDESNGYLFVVGYINREIHLHVFHGIADGRAISSFGSSLIYQYLVLSGKVRDEEAPVMLREAIQDTSETEEYFDRCLEYSSKFPKGSVMSVPGEVFVIPEERQYYDSDSSRCFEIVWPAEEYKNACNKSGGTALTFMAAVITTAIYRLYDVKGQTVTFNVPVDMRQILNIRPAGNYTTNIKLPYTGDGNCTFDEMIRLYKNEMDVRLKPGNLIANALGSKEVLEELTNIPINDRDELDRLHAGLKAGTKADSTMLLSNIGIFRMPDSMRDQVTDFRFRAVNIAYVPDAFMVTMGDKGRLFVGQNYEDTKLLECICRVMKEHGVAAGLNDFGCFTADPVLPYLFKKIV